jgi:hypothetical protein
VTSKPTAPDPAGAPSGWRDIASAPKDMRHVLLYGCDVMPVVGYYSKSTGRWFLSGSVAEDAFCLLTPTHWMPLPAPPEAP